MALQHAQVQAKPLPMQPAVLGCVAAARQPAAGLRAPARGGAAAASRAAMVAQVQRSQGNHAVQRMLRGADVQLMKAPAPAVAARQPDPAPPQAAPDDRPWWQQAVFGDSVAWRMVDQFAPELGPIVRKGPVGVIDWLKDRAGTAAGAVVDKVMAPVRSVAGLGSTLSAQFAPMVASLQEAATKIAANDCSPISQAAQRIENAAERIVTPIIEKLQPVVAKIQSVLSAAWDTIGAPIWEWIKSYAATQWQQMTQLASWIWSLGEPMRSLSAEAWSWLKNKLGIGDGPEGENGILQWVQGKLESAWQTVKATLEPFRAQIGVVTGVVASVAQVVAGPVTAVARLAPQIASGIAWVAGNLGKGDLIVRSRDYVEKTLIPPLSAGMQQASLAVLGAAGAVSGALGSLASSLDGTAAAVGNSVLSFAASTIKWVAEQVHALAAWANERLAAVAGSLATALTRFQGFLRDLANFLHKVQGVALNVLGLPGLLFDAAWKRIPACLRDPVVDFLVPLVLRQIEIFEELVRDNVAWQKTKAQVMKIVHRIFVDGDLVGAAKDTFALLMRTFNIPPELLASVAAKAMAAWDVVSKKPLEFLKNTVRSLGHGFKLLWANIGTHLEHGIEGWLFGELKEKDIHPPASWTDPKALFGFVVEVLGLSMGHITELVKQRIDPTLVDKAQAWIGRFGRAWDWITDVINTSKSPAENSQGLIAKAKDFGTSILTGAAEWVAGKVAAELATLAAAAAASGGLSEVIDVVRRIYKAMVTAKRWAGQILKMASDTLDRVLDIASGNVAKVGGDFEKIMDRGMPVVIGFLADQVGLGGVGSAIRNIVEKLREKVDAAILWLIGKVKAGVEALLRGVAKGVAAITNWWNETFNFTNKDGESHTLQFIGGGDSAEMGIATTLMPVSTYLDTHPLKGSDEWIDAKAKFEAAKKVIYSHELKSSEEKLRRQRIKQELAKVSAAFAKLGGGGPTSEDEYDPKPVPSYGNPATIEAVVGKPQEGSITGPWPVSMPGYKEIYDAGLTEATDKWVQMHIISEKLGGTGEDHKNLIPAPHSVNAGPFRSFEHATLALVKAKSAGVKNRVWVEVRVSGSKTRPSAISGKSGLWFWQGKRKGWLKNATPAFAVSVGIPEPQTKKGPRKLTLNFTSSTEMRRDFGISSETAALVKQGRPYSSQAQFISDMKTRGATNAQIAALFSRGAVLDGP